MTPRKPYMPGDRYKWVALTNTTAGVLLATIDASIMIIAMPDIFRGIGFAQTPLWAGIYMLPTSLGMLIAGPLSGYLSDRFGARPFATGGMIAAACTFVGLELLPIDFPYPLFAMILLLNGLAMGCFASPNRAAVMNALPRPA